MSHTSMSKFMISGCSLRNPMYMFSNKEVLLLTSICWSKRTFLLYIYVGFHVHIYIYTRENQQMHKLLFNLLVMYGGFYMFRHYIAFLRELSYILMRDVLY
jgi:hypothetical protein